MITQFSRRQIRGAWWGTVILFLAHGLIVSTWLSRIPAVQTSIGLSNGRLGLILLSSALGALCCIPITGLLISRFGSKPVTFIASCLFTFTLFGLSSATSGLQLSLALFFFGCLAGAMDVSMNAQGVDVEKALSTPTMSRFHGMFSLGGMAGSAVGGLLAAHGWSVASHFSLSSALNLAAIFCTWRLLLPAHEAAISHEHRLPLNKIPPVLLALSAIGFCILLAEGAVADWTAVYLRQILHAGSGMAAQGYASFSAAMAIFRMLGDLVTAKLGPMRTVRWGSLIAAVGIGGALMATKAGWALPGFALAGAGLSVIIPLVFGSGGRVPSINPGAGIATVTGIGYIGFIVGPPTIGLASQASNLRYGLSIVVLCCLVSAVLAQSMRRLWPVSEP